MHALPLHDSIVVMSEENTIHQQSAQNVSSEAFGTSRNDAEPFRLIPKDAEKVGSVPNLSDELERVEKYSLTVREVARMFEEAGVPRTERSIVKWCAKDPNGIPRLTCRLDAIEHRWFITEESVRLAIAEEVIKQRELEARSAQAHEHPPPGEGYADRMKEDAHEERTNERVFEQMDFEEEASLAEKDKIIRELEYKLRDEQIASRAKDMVIEQMEKDRKHLLDQATGWSRQVGVLETKLLQIEAPRQSHENHISSEKLYHHTDVPNRSEQHEENQAREREPGWQGEQYQ
jgi:hypothetical protein